MLQHLLQTPRNAVIPIVGEGVTIGIGSDCYPATIIHIDIEKGMITIQRDIETPAEGFDYFTNQVYTYTRNTLGAIEVWSLRKNGQMKRVGARMDDCYYLSFNGRRYYRDPSF